MYHSLGVRGGRCPRALTASGRRGGVHGRLGVPKGVPVAGGVVVCISRLEGRCVAQLLQVAEPACALRRTVARPSQSPSHSADNGVRPRTRPRARPRAAYRKRDAAFIKDAKPEQGGEKAGYFCKELQKIPPGRGNVLRTGDSVGQQISDDSFNKRKKVSGL